MILLIISLICQFAEGSLQSLNTREQFIRLENSRFVLVFILTLNIPVEIFHFSLLL